MQVKTTACPVVLLPAPQGVAGAWEEAANDAMGLKYLFRDGDGAIRGYVFTQDYCQERMDMDRALSEPLTGVAA